MADCSTTQQGYPNVHFHHDCDLSHTGFPLAPVLVLAVVLIVVAAVLLTLGRRST